MRLPSVIYCDPVDKLGDMIQLHRLEGFHWVAKTGGYARAARAFPYPITQPAVHQQVRKLEDELGMSLFERVAKERVQLTPAGRTLHRFVAPFFEGLPAVVRAVRGQEQGGELVVFAEPLLLRHLLPAWLLRMQQAAPQLELDLHEMRDVDVVPLRAGAADLLVCYLPEPPDDVATQRVATLKPYLVLPADHPKAKRKRLAPKDIEKEAFIAYTKGSRVHDLQLQALAQFGVRPERQIHVTSADTILGFVASGLGYSIVPHLDDNGPVTAGVCSHRLVRPKVEFDVVAVWRRDAPENRMLDVALETAPQV